MLAKFMNMIMQDGKKSVAERIVYGALEQIRRREQPEKSPWKCLTRPSTTSSPMVEVKSRRVGGATYQVPVEVRPARRQTLAMRWVIDAARKRGEKSMAQRLADELLDASRSAARSEEARRHAPHG